MQALKERKTSREFSNESLSFQLIADLLWADFGVNRPETKGRTAPSAMNSKDNPHTNRGISKVEIRPDNSARVVIAINLFMQ